MAHNSRIICEALFYFVARGAENKKTKINCANNIYMYILLNEIAPTSVLLTL